MQRRSRVNLACSMGMHKLKYVRLEWLSKRVVVHRNYVNFLEFISDVASKSTNGHPSCWYNGHILNGILFSKDYGWNPCVVESDKLEAVDRVLNNTLRYASYSSIVSEIAALRAGSNGMNICAISSSANRFARHLAKYILDKWENTFWMEDFPSCVGVLVESDKPN
ncbi:hypothetical protein Ddye_010276 [Dipteronia dyeriana]|uniref:RNase H type-1 domain-containing protein n=1 Tax=Dipteronia dyeriana TaxID=168575 RepID=A0AAD9XD21_9ROSI|nr:hypothetical protein Ddye_010276 [Dipteronia dyeriana]